MLTNTSKPAPLNSPGLLKTLLDLVRAWLLLMQRRGFAMPRRARRPRAWQLRIEPKMQPVALNQSDVDQLLQRHRDLNDMEKLALVAGSFRMPESNFFSDPRQVERLIRHFLEQNPPWLHVGQVLPGGEENETGGETQQEVVWRERVTREVQDVTLFVPSEIWRDQPLASLTLRPARQLNEMYQARLLDQILPPTLLLDRLTRGEILIPNRHRTRHRLEFEAQDRQLEVVVRKPVAIPIETEGAGGKGGQLLYILMDYSASMAGKSATLALAVITATLRANMGRRDARYLFRRYAQEDSLWPREVEPPLQARTLAEKDALLDTILATNFNGGATHINHALNIAVTDIESLRREEHLEATVLLVTDGRAEMLESTGLRLRAADVKVHTVMVTPEPNPSLQALSESFTALDIRPDGEPSGQEPAPISIEQSVPHSAQI
jgi:hypothetical protein